jgi:RNA polymerase-binding transcription factor DksA
MDDAHARELLEAERARLLTLDADVRGVSEASPGEGEEQRATGMGTDTHDRSRDLGLLEQYERELAEIEEALQRLEEGRYGICEVCGKPIPDERLEANPTARFDVEHERSIERGFRS